MLRPLADAVPRSIVSCFGVVAGSGLYGVAVVRDGFDGARVTTAGGAAAAPVAAPSSSFVDKRLHDLLRRGVVLHPDVFDRLGAVERDPPLAQDRGRLGVIDLEDLE